MSEKENILARIREALQIAAPLPGQHGVPPLGGSAHDSLNTPTATPDRLKAGFQTPQKWLPSVGSTFEEQISLFQRNALDLKADLHLLNSPEDLSTQLVRLR